MTSEKDVPFVSEQYDTDITSEEMFEQIGGPEAPDVLNETPAPLMLGSYTSEQPVFDASEIRMPRLAITQGQSKAVQDGIAKPGKWYMEGMDQAHEVIHIVPVQFAYRQEYRPDSDNFLNLECWASSANKAALVGQGKFKGRTCTECPLFQWNGNTPPACTGIISYLVYVKEYDSFAAVDFKSTHYTAGKQLNTLVLMRRIGNFVAKMGVASKESKKGKNYIPTVTIDLSDRDSVVRARDMLGAH